VSRAFSAEDFFGGCAERGDAQPPSWRRLLAVEGQAARKESDMRVTTAFNRLLRLPGASVIDVSFSSEGVIVAIRLRRGGGSAPGAGSSAATFTTGGSSAGGIWTSGSTGA